MIILSEIKSLSINYFYICRDVACNVSAKHIIKIFYFLMLIFLIVSCTPDSGSKGQVQNQFEPDWRSLKRHQTPQWLSDAKFGIYCHWNPSRYPDSTLFGKNFDAEEWANLFEKAGAQFAGPGSERVALPPDSPKQRPLCT